LIDQVELRRKGSFGIYNLRLNGSDRVVPVPIILMLRSATGRRVVGSYYVEISETFRYLPEMMSILGSAGTQD